MSPRSCHGKQSGQKAPVDLTAVHLKERFLVRRGASPCAAFWPHEALEWASNGVRSAQSKIFGSISQSETAIQ